jgi:hypothetical protein
MTTERAARAPNAPATAGPRQCRLCGTTLRHTFVDLGMSPPCESYLPAVRLDEMEPFYPLHVRVCDRCFLVQLHDYIPPEDIRHTSARQIGQIYVPALNWLMAIGTIGLVLAFGSSSRLASAYGIAVSGTMVITTILMYAVVRRVWKWEAPLAAAYLVGRGGSFRDFRATHIPHLSAVRLEPGPPELVDPAQALGAC